MAITFPLLHAYLANPRVKNNAIKVDLHNASPGEMSRRDSDTCHEVTRSKTLENAAYKNIAGPLNDNEVVMYIWTNVVARAKRFN